MDEAVFDTVEAQGYKFNRATYPNGIVIMWVSNPAFYEKHIFINKPDEIIKRTETSKVLQRTGKESS